MMDRSKRLNENFICEKSQSRIAQDHMIRSKARKADRKKLNSLESKMVN